MTCCIFGYIGCKDSKKIGNLPHGPCAFFRRWPGGRRGDESRDEGKQDERHIRRDVAQHAGERRIAAGDTGVLKRVGICEKEGHVEREKPSSVYNLRGRGEGWDERLKKYIAGKR